LRDLLAGTGISFGLYVGKTPERTTDVAGERLPAGSSRTSYRVALERARGEKRGTAVHPPEERVSREEMRPPGKQPWILLTNVKQLELLLTRQKDVELFVGARLEFLVFDEARTYGGVDGAETACLIRRIRAFCEAGSQNAVCVATSATLAEPETGTEAAKAFAEHFLGVSDQQVGLITEEYQQDEWTPVRRLCAASAPAAPAMPATRAEARLRDMMQRAGSPAGEWHRQIRIG